MSDKLSRRTSIKIWSKVRFFPLCSQFWERRDPFLPLTVTGLCSRQITDKICFQKKWITGYFKYSDEKGQICCITYTERWILLDFPLTRKLRQLNWIQIKQVAYWKINHPYYIRFNIEEAKILENSVTHESCFSGSW